VPSKRKGRGPGAAAGGTGDPRRRLRRKSRRAAPQRPGLRLLPPRYTLQMQLDALEQGGGGGDGNVGSAGPGSAATPPGLEELAAE
jgi:hypothetical protein